MKLRKALDKAKKDRRKYTPSPTDPDVAEPLRRLLDHGS